MNFKSMITNTFNALDRSIFGSRFYQALNASRTRGNMFRTFYADRRSPVLVDMDDLFDVYQECPPLQIVINEKAEMLSNGIFKVRKKTDKEEVVTHWSIDLMKNPNPLQAQKEYIYEYGILSGIYANSFVYRNQPFAGRPSKTLWNLPPAMMKIIPTGKLYEQTELSGIIEKYILMGAEQKSWTTDEVIHTNTGVSKSALLSDSKMIALRLPISNIIGSLKTRNIFIYKGPKMLITSKGQDGEGSAIPLGEVEKKRVEHQTNSDYGISDHQNHTVVTTASLTVEKMSYPTKDMMLFEECEEDFGWICGSYGMDRDIFPSTKGATNENKKQGLKSTYQTTIDTEAKAFCNFIDTLLNLDAEGLECYLCYSHLPVMQDDKKAAAEERKINAETNNILFAAGIISDDAYAEMMEVEMTGKPQQKNDSLGKIPLALQQLALAQERANTAGNKEQSAALAEAIDLLTTRLVESVTNNTNNE